MRIQILPLPPKTIGDATHTPFVIAVDRCTDRTLDFFRSFPQYLDSLQDDWGAAGMIFGDVEDLELPGALDLPRELQDAISAHIAATTTGDPS